jgi:5-(carboxyamino)imidazole ribonucleotide synthase
MAIIPPGSRIGILGGGQLGRMTAMAARTMGYSVHILDPDAKCSASPVADRVVAARFDDAGAAADLAMNCDVVTLEIEQIGVDALSAASRHAPLRPGVEVLAVIQDRATQKSWLDLHGFPVGPYQEIRSAADLERAATELGPLFVKACRGGYDGRSQGRVATPSEAESMWDSLGKRHSVAEKALDLEAELSVMVARSPSGEIRVFPPSLNVHERQILSWSVIPAPLPQKTLADAEAVARGIAENFRLEGILAVELFLLRDGSLLVNELAPRPHNSVHQTEVACSTSQFEQLVRAACDLPLGDPGVRRPGAIFNLFGEHWEAGPPPFERALAQPGVRLHLYGKRGARRGRKMGHLSAIGDTAEDALARVRAAAAAIGATIE